MAVLLATDRTTEAKLSARYTAVYKDRRQADITTIAYGDRFDEILDTLYGYFAQRSDVLQHCAYAGIIELGRGAIVYLAPQALAPIGLHVEGLGLIQ